MEIRDGNQMKKTLISSAVALLLGASAANATVSGSVMLCDAHDWQRFAEAMEAQDQAALQALADGGGLCRSG